MIRAEGRQHMIRVAIVEDDEQDRKKLVACLKQYETKRKVQFDIVEFTDGEDIALNYTADFDLIFMDIEMAFMNGMRAAQRIRELDSAVTLIFITNMPQYALQGYKVSALDYVLKPISYFSLSETISKALKSVRKPEKKYIVIDARGIKVKLDVSQICYVEVLDHSLKYHSTEGKFEAKGTLHGAMEQLDEKVFFLCNRCYLVNLDYVDAVRDSEVFVHGDMITVSRSRKKAFLNALNERMNGDGTI